MRWSLLQSFSKLLVLDLHGNSNKKETAPDGSKDENVFDISQGVAVSLLVRLTTPCVPRSLNLSDLWGSRSDAISGKYRWLTGHSSTDTPWEEAAPTKPLLLFKKSGGDVQHEYEDYPSLADVMPLYSMGIKSSRDDLVLDFEAKPILERIERFRSARVSDESICEELGVPLKKGWNIAKARKDLRALKHLPAQIQSFLYRPLDWRLLFYHRAAVFSVAYPVMQHLLSGRNLAFVATRQTKDQWDVQCSRALVGHKSLGAYDANSVFPLFLAKDPTQSQRTLTNEPRINVAAPFLKRLSGVLRIPQKGVDGLPAGLTPEDIFHYAYAVFHSPGYRSRYAEFLKVDFPRLPLTGNLECFRMLAQLGGELTALHLLESPTLDQPTSELIGGPNPEVEKVSWSKKTVWLNKAQTAGFKGVREDVWNFHIGGYKVCEKWLKDRKGRRLSKDDTAHYQKIVVALAETIRLMKEIDKAIAGHGGWPDAFRTGLNIPLRPVKVLVPKPIVPKIA
jgi:predicted helicase